MTKESKKKKFLSLSSSMQQSLPSLRVLCLLKRKIGAERVNSFLTQVLFVTYFPPDASAFCNTLSNWSYMLISSNHMNFIAMGTFVKKKNIALI